MSRTPEVCIYEVLVLCLFRYLSIRKSEMAPEISEYKVFKGNVCLLSTYKVPDIESFYLHYIVLE